MMRKSLAAAVAITGLCVAAGAHAQAPAKGGVNAGTLTCNVAGGMGFVFGSSKSLDCIFARSNGTAEHYTGTVKKFGIDIGFTKEGHIVWMVVAPGAVTPGALEGDYVGGTGSVALGAGMGANALIGGGSKQFSLQPVSIEGSMGLNVAAGLMNIELKKAS